MESPHFCARIKQDGVAGKQTPACLGDTTEESRHWIVPEKNPARSTDTLQRTAVRFATTTCIDEDIFSPLDPRTVWREPLFLRERVEHNGRRQPGEPDPMLPVPDLREVTCTVWSRKPSRQAPWPCLFFHSLVRKPGARKKTCPVPRNRHCLSASGHSKANSKHHRWAGLVAAVPSRRTTCCQELRIGHTLDCARHSAKKRAGGPPAFWSFPGLSETSFGAMASRACGSKLGVTRKVWCPFPTNDLETSLRLHKSSCIGTLLTDILCHKPGRACDRPTPLAAFVRYRIACDLRLRGLRGL